MMRCVLSCIFEFNHVVRKIIWGLCKCLSVSQTVIQNFLVDSCTHEGKLTHVARRIFCHGVVENFFALVTVSIGSNCAALFLSGAALEKEEPMALEAHLMKGFGWVDFVSLC